MARPRAPVSSRWIWTAFRKHARSGDRVAARPSNGTSHFVRSTWSAANCWGRKYGHEALEESAHEYDVLAISVYYAQSSASAIVVQPASPAQVGIPAAGCGNACPPAVRQANLDCASDHGRPSYRAACRRSTHHDQRLALLPGQHSNRDWLYLLGAAWGLKTAGRRFVKSPVYSVWDRRGWGVECRNDSGWEPSCRRSGNRPRPVGH